MPLTKKINGQSVEMTPEEEAAITAKWSAWESNVKPVIERRDTFESGLRAAKANLTNAEIDVLVAIYNEIKRWQIDNTADTPLLDAAHAVFTGRSKPQVATKIVNKVENYLTTAATALAVKIKGDEA